jgi:hypothetical protein
MITYNTIIEVATEIANNKLIPKEGLVIVYELDEENHLKLDEDLFYRSNKDIPGAVFTHTDVFEVPFTEFIFKFIQKKL